MPPGDFENQPLTGVYNRAMTAAAQSATDCQEKRRLHHIYEVAVGDYSRAFGLLESGVVMHGPVYDRLREYIEAARQTSEEARIALDLYIAEHDCN
jgi:hypothetical protein